MAKVQKAVGFIEKKGALLVFPINNQKAPPSLWSELYPKSEMRWEWDSGGDNRVADLWHLREALSRSGKVVYTKWYKGRATFFSRNLFPAVLATLHGCRGRYPISSTAESLLRILEENSPISTKALKKESGLTGKSNEGSYTKALKELWDQLLIVGFGEVDDGAFPSLAVGATSLLFDELWEEARSLSHTQAHQILAKTWTNDSLFLKYLESLWKKHPKPGLETTKKKKILRGSDVFLAPRDRT